MEQVIDRPNLHTAQSIRDILQTSPLVNGSAKCEQCGLRAKAYYKHSYRKWCQRCIDVYQRPKPSERYLCAVLGAKYWQAHLSHLQSEIREKLQEVDAAQDIFFVGPVGTGKTYAMAALFRAYAYAGYECEKICFDEFCVQVRSTMSAASHLTERDMTEPLKNVDKLFIDDLGLRSKTETDFAYVTLYQILDKRQQRCLPTIISSNKTIDDLAQTFDARIASRLHTATVIQFSGPDRRR